MSEQVEPQEESTPSQAPFPLIDDKEHRFPTLSIIEERVSQLFAEELSQSFQISPRIWLERSRLEKWGAVVRSFGDTGCFGYLQFEALGGFGLLSIDPELLYGLQERLLGGGHSGSFSGWRPSKPRERFTPVEERVVRRIVRLFGRSLESAWRPIVPLKAAHLRVESKATRCAIATPEEWVVVSRYQLEAEGLKGAVQLVLPQAMLDQYSRQLETGVYEKATRGDESWHRSMRQSMRGIPIRMSAELGRAELLLSELLALKIGDVVRLDQSPEDPVVVLVEGESKFHAEPTVLHGNLAVLLQSLHGES